MERAAVGVHRSRKEHGGSRQQAGSGLGLNESIRASAPPDCLPVVIVIVIVVVGHQSMVDGSG